MAKKKQEEKNEEVEVVADPIISFTDVTFCPVWNETEKRYDMLTIYINGPFGEVVKVEREATRYATKPRATKDVIEKVTKYFMTGRFK